MRKSNCRLAAEAALLVMWIGVVWWQSLLPPAVSSVESSWVEAFLRAYLPFVLVFPVRKLAHFAEFALLGALAAFVLRRLRQPLWQHAVNTLFLGLLVAVSDEFIQSFTGRGPMVSDVVLDFCGCVFGAAVCLLLLHIIMKKKDRSVPGKYTDEQ